MKKFIAIALTVIAIVAIADVNLENTNKVTTEEMYFGDTIRGTYEDVELKVIEVDYENHLVYGIDNNGDVWGFYAYGISEGETVIAIKETETQKIVDLR